MLTFDTTTMILCAVLIVMSIVSPMMNVFFRKIKKTPSDSVLQGELPPVSILLTVHDNARDLERHLPSLLAQDYPAGYEVIIVVEKGEDDTDDVLSHFTANHQNVYVTFVPDSSRYMSRKKLAVTLGVKAAKNQWILMAEPTCEPASDQWLKNIAQFADDNHDMVTGYANYNEDATDYQRFERMMTECYLIWKAQHGTAYRSEPGCLMFRKNMFLDGRGYEGNLKYIRGEYDFVVNKYAEKGRTAAVAMPECCTVEDAPDKEQWRNRHLFYLETRKHLKRSAAFRLLYNADQTAMHLNYVLILGCCIYAAITSNIIVGAAALIALIITIALRTFFACRASSFFGENIPGWKVVPMELSMLWRNIHRKLAYIRADKYDFICHKI